MRVEWRMPLANLGRVSSRVRVTLGKVPAARLCLRPLLLQADLGGGPLWLLADMLQSPSQICSVVLGLLFWIHALGQVALHDVLVRGALGLVVWIVGRKGYTHSAVKSSVALQTVLVAFIGLVSVL